MAELRRNRVKHKLAEGGVATVPMGPVTPDIIEHLCQLDFDGIWIEGEHGPIDFRDIPDMSRACDLWGKTSIVRVNLNLAGVIYRTLDNGAMGIVVPHVDTAEEARAVVDAAKFAPLGSRGSYTSRQGYGVEDYLRKANEETLVVVLLESATAMKNLSEILNVDNIDVFFIAPGDLAQSMGYLGQPAHSEVLAAVDKGFDQINAAGKVAGTMVPDGSVDRWLEKGVRFLGVTWMPWLSAGAKSYLDRVAAASPR